MLKVLRSICMELQEEDVNRDVIKKRNTGRYHHCTRPPENRRPHGRYFSQDRNAKFQFSEICFFMVSNHNNILLFRFHYHMKGWSDFKVTYFNPHQEFTNYDLNFSKGFNSCDSAYLFHLFKLDKMPSSILFTWTNLLQKVCGGNELKQNIE